VARSSSDGEKAVQEWQRAMKSPSPSEWRPSNAVKQLEADTIALAAGAVTAMLAANAAVAGPIDSPEKVWSSRDFLMCLLSLGDLLMRNLSCIVNAMCLPCSFDGLPLAAEPSPRAEQCQRVASAVSNLESWQFAE